MKYRIKWKFVCFEEWIKMSVQCDPIFFFLFRRWSSSFSVSKLGHLTRPPRPFLLLSRLWKRAQRPPSCYRTSVRRRRPGLRAWAGEAAQPWGLLRRHQEEAGGGRGEQRDLQPWVLQCLASGCVGTNGGTTFSLLAFVQTTFPFCLFLWTREAWERFSPKGRSICHRSCESRKMFW